MSSDYQAVIRRPVPAWRMSLAGRSGPAGLSRESVPRPFWLGVRGALTN